MKKLTMNWKKLELVSALAERELIEEDVSNMRQLEHHKFLWIFHSDGSTTVIPVELGYPISAAKNVITCIDKVFFVNEDTVSRITKDYAIDLMDSPPPVCISDTATPEEAYASIENLLSKSPAYAGLNAPVNASTIKSVISNLHRKGKIKLLRFVDQTLVKAGLLPQL